MKRRGFVAMMGSGSLLTVAGANAFGKSSVDKAILNSLKERLDYTSKLLKQAQKYIL